MVEDKFKRHIAFKLRIGSLVSGKPIIEGEKFLYLELDGKNVTRVNVVGNIIEKYDSTGEKNYSFLTIDDGSGQIKLKAFSDDVEKLKDLSQGDTILVIGVLRNFNNETYISPEIVRKQNPKYLLIRKLEVEKQRSANPIQTTQKIVAVKDRILGAIKNSENGIELDQLIVNLRDLSPEIIKQETQKFIEEGIIFEPRPNILKYLG